MSKCKALKWISVNFWPKPSSTPVQTQPALKPMFCLSYSVTILFCKVLGQIPCGKDARRHKNYTSITSCSIYGLHLEYFYHFQWSHSWPMPIRYDAACSIISKWRRDPGTFTLLCCSLVLVIFSFSFFFFLNQDLHVKTTARPDQLKYFFLPLLLCKNWTKTIQI